MPTMTSLIPGAFVLADVLTRERCQALIRWTEGLGYRPAEIHSRFGTSRRVSSLRNNDRVIVDDEALAEELLAGLREWLPDDLFAGPPLGLNERFRFYRYRSGQRFGWHCDGRYQRENGEGSRLTVLIYLNEGFRGGETRFEKAAVEPRSGLGLVFAHSLRHKGATIVSGTKYVLRSDVMYGPLRSP